VSECGVGVVFIHQSVEAKGRGPGQSTTGIGISPPY
jgi:hypothetical protein